MILKRMAFAAGLAVAGLTLMSTPSLAADMSAGCEEPVPDAGTAFAYYADPSGLPTTFCQAFRMNLPDGIGDSAYTYEQTFTLPDEYFDPSWIGH
jgi:hypothetical protein